jgi:hypothetical protein
MPLHESILKIREKLIKDLQNMTFFIQILEVKLESDNIACFKEVQTTK